MEKYIVRVHDPVKGVLYLSGDQWVKQESYATECQSLMEVTPVLEKLKETYKEESKRFFMKDTLMVIRTVCQIPRPEMARLGTELHLNS